nr:hypothetical protein [Tanacetum cinerariifolium]
MNQNINSSGFDQIQPPRYLVIHHPSQETSEEILQVKEKLMKSIQTILKKFNRISFKEMPKVLSQAWEKFFEIQHAQPEDSHELLCKLLGDLQIISKELAEYINSLCWNHLAFYDDDDEHFIQYKEYLENSSNAITPVLPTEEPDNSLSMGDEHLSTIPKTESDKVVKSSVKNLVPILRESKVTSDNESECDVPVNEEYSPIFMTFSNTLFDCNDDFTSTDYKSLLNHDTLIDSSLKFDFLLDEFSGELAHINLIPSGIEEADFDLEEEIRLVENLLYDNSSPRPPEDLNVEIVDTIVDNDTLPLPENESSNFDHYDDPSFPRPHPEPPDVKILFDFKPAMGVLTTKVVEDISEHHVLMPKVLPTQHTLCLNIDPLLLFSPKNEDKVFKPGILSYLLVSHRDKTISNFSKDLMMMYGGDIPLLDVLFLYFCPL